MNEPQNLINNLMKNGRQINKEIDINGESNKWCTAWLYQNNMKAQYNGDKRANYEQNDLYESQINKQTSKKK